MQKEVNVSIFRRSSGDHRRGSGEQGFTLVELLVVMLILGVLATIAVPSFLAQRSRSWNAAAKSDSRNASKIVTSLEADGQLPVTLTVAAITAAGFEPSPNITHALCAMNDGSFGFGSKHSESDSIWLVDLEGRLVEVVGGTLQDALDGIAGGACDVYDES